MAKKIATSRLSRRWTLCLSSIVLLGAAPRTTYAQYLRHSPDVQSRDSYWSRLALGFGVSVLAHESAHIVTAMLLGAHPYVGFDKARPTIYSGIDSQREPHKQFIFSASGLTTQDLINEIILDIPHAKGSPFERGILAGGIGTTIFYISIGRNGAVSDIAFMSRTSSLSKNQLSLIFGGVSAVQAWRITRDPRYDHFFVHPTGSGMAIGFTY
ncbi:MAG TPA: hypothetical protein VGD02_01845 [Gemmatimonadaceae bacterium]